MNVTLFNVKKKADTTAKILTICRKAVEKKIYLQICCPDQKAAVFLDEFLWKFSGEAFLPHAVDETRTVEPILISLKTELTKPFTHVLWLCPTPPRKDLRWVHLYDFDDQTSEGSREKSQSRYHFYKELGCKISLLS